MPVVDPEGDAIGKLRDVVIQRRTANRPPKVKAIVVELFARRRIYVPMERVFSVDAQQIVTTGAVNTRRFLRREGETLVVEDLFDRQVVPLGSAVATRIYDVAMHTGRAGDWETHRVALRQTSRSPFGRTQPIQIVDWQDVAELSLKSGSDADTQVAGMIDMKPADVARELHDMPPERRAEVAGALDDDTLADAIQELPEDEAVDLITLLDPERAADVLEEMDPDDAADLISDLPEELAQRLLDRMRPEDAQDVRDLLAYEDDTAGGMMTPEPVIVPPDATVADALALVRNEDIPPALAGMVFVARAPLEVPTGRFLGGVHLQRLLREPPSTFVSTLIDGELKPFTPTADLAQVSRFFATYDVVVVPVVDAQRRLLGAVTVDDVLDHMLPDDWRSLQMDSALAAEEEPRHG